MHRWSGAGNGCFRSKIAGTPRDSEGCAPSWVGFGNHHTSHMPQLSLIIRHTAAGAWPGHPNHSGTDGLRRHQNHRGPIGVRSRGSAYQTRIGSELRQNLDGADVLTGSRRFPLAFRRQGRREWGLMRIRSKPIQRIDKSGLVHLNKRTVFITSR